MRLRAAVASAAAGLILLTPQAPRALTADIPDRVTFPSADHKTTLVGYVYTPEGARRACTRRGDDARTRRPLLQAREWRL